MVKHLTVIYNGGSGPLQLFDGAVEGLTFTDTANGIKIEGHLKKAASGGQGGTFFDLITKASKANTQKLADEKRAEIASD